MISINNILSNKVSWIELPPKQKSLSPPNFIVSQAIELHIYTSDNRYIKSLYDIDWSILDNNIRFNIHKILRDSQLNFGLVKTAFNYLNLIFGDNLNKYATVSSISQSRTEIKIINNTGQQKIFEQLDQYQKTDDHGNQNILILNFGNNILIECDNWILLNDKSIVLKTISTIPQEISINENCFICTKFSNSTTDNIKIIPPEKSLDVNVLSSANFAEIANINRRRETNYQNWVTLTSPSTKLSETIISKYTGINSSDIDLNIDYRKYDNFVFYSSAAKRLENFIYKLKLIENYRTSISKLINVTSSLNTTNIDQYQNKINDLLGGFDGYENYMYYESGSYSSGSYGKFYPATWPKVNSKKPYILYSVTASEGIDWYQGAYQSASYYDRENINILNNLIPPFIREDSNGQYYETFINMIGQQFDQIYLYVKHLDILTDRHESLYEGLSKDLIYSVLESYGWNPEEGHQYDELFSYAFGTNSSGSYQYSSSINEHRIFAVSESVPRGDISKEISKRLLNNLPFILKTKGTEESVQAILNCYGVPSTILRIKEYGGQEPLNAKSYYNYDKFTYALNFANSEYVQFNYGTLQQSELTPNTIEFRFKTENLKDQTLFYSSDYNWGMYMYHSQSFLGQLNFVIKPFGLLGITYKCSINSVPIYDDNWWNVMIRHNQMNNNPAGTHTFDVIIGQAKYENIERLYSSSLSLNGSGGPSSNPYLALKNIFKYNTLNYGKGAFGFSTNNFKGQSQEFRYWSTPLTVESFTNHILAATSYVGNNLTASFDDLSLRYQWGTDVNSYDHSITTNLSSQHPNQNIKTFASSSYNLDATFHGFTTGNSYTSQEEIYSLNWPDLSGNRQLSNKIRIEENSLIAPLNNKVRSEEFTTDKYPIDSAKIGIYLSPTNEVNEDIAEQMGGFRIDDYIGDPSYNFTQTYIALEHLKRFYFQKYLGKYNAQEYLRLADYFDQSLYTQIKKVLPARAKKIVGTVIESDILNRSKQIIIRDNPIFENEYCEAIIDSNDYINMLGEYDTFTASINEQPIIITGDVPCFTSFPQGGFLQGDDSEIYRKNLQPSVSNWDNLLPQQVYFTSWHSASQAQEINIGGAPWTHMLYVSSSDGLYATASHIFGGVGNISTNILRTYDYGFNIPQNSEIKAIEIMINGIKSNNFSHRTPVSQTKIWISNGVTTDLNPPIIPAYDYYSRSIFKNITFNDFIYYDTPNGWNSLELYTVDDINKSTFSINFEGELSVIFAPGATVILNIDQIAVRIYYRNLTAVISDSSTLQYDYFPNSYSQRNNIMPTIYDITSFSGSIERYITGSISGSNLDNVENRLKSMNLNRTEISRITTLPIGTRNQRYNGCKVDSNTITPDGGPAFEWWLSDLGGLSQNNNVSIIKNVTWKNVPNVLPNNTTPAL